MSNQTDEITEVTSASFFETDTLAFIKKVPAKPLCLGNIRNVHIVCGRTLGIWFKDGTHVNFEISKEE